MSKVCDKCGVETKRFAQCVKEEKTWYECADFDDCQRRVWQAEEQKREETRAKKDQEFQDQFGEIDPDDLIEVGVMYRDGTTYYYHTESDTLFGQKFHSNTFERRDGGISSYERKFIEKALED